MPNYGTVARSKFDYEGEEAHELTFDVGAIITNIEATESDNWKKGTYKGKVGIFPVNFVDLFLPEDGVCGYAEFEYTGGEDDELNFAEGDSIRSIEDTESADWKIGKKDGKRGLFPANHVAVIDESKGPRSNEKAKAAPAAAKPSLTPAASPVVATASKPQAAAAAAPVVKPQAAAAVAVIPAATSSKPQAAAPAASSSSASKAGSGSAVDDLEAKKREIAAQQAAIEREAAKLKAEEDRLIAIENERRRQEQLEFERQRAAEAAEAERLRREAAEAERIRKEEEKRAEALRKERDKAAKKEAERRDKERKRIEKEEARIAKEEAAIVARRAQLEADKAQCTRDKAILVEDEKKPLVDEELYRFVSREEQKNGGGSSGSSGASSAAAAKGPLPPVGGPQGGVATAMATPPMANRAAANNTPQPTAAATNAQRKKTSDALLPASAVIRPVPEPKGEARTVPTPSRTATAIFDCTGEQADELTFKKGDVITDIKTTENPEWGKGTCNGKTGFFPLNYVSEVKTSSSAGGSSSSNHEPTLSRQRSTTNTNDNGISLHPSAAEAKQYADFAGWLSKANSSGRLYKRRFCVLCQFILHYYAGPTSPEPVASITLPSYNVALHPKKENNFTISHSNVRTYVFQADNRESLEAWMVVLGQATRMETIVPPAGAAGRNPYAVDEDVFEDDVPEEEDDERSDTPPPPARANPGPALNSAPPRPAERAATTAGESASANEDKPAVAGPKRPFGAVDPFGGKNIVLPPKKDGSGSTAATSPAASAPSPTATSSKPLPTPAARPTPTPAPKPSKADTEERAVSPPGVRPTPGTGVKPTPAPKPSGSTSPTRSKSPTRPVAATAASPVPAPKPAPKPAAKPKPVA